MVNVSTIQSLTAESQIKITEAGIIKAAEEGQSYSWISGAVLPGTLQHFKKLGFKVHYQESCSSRISWLPAGVESPF
jgi:hypothetical protein